MPPKQTTSSLSRVTGTGTGNGNRASTTSNSRKRQAPPPTDDELQNDSLDDEDEDKSKAIPAELLTRLLHEFFTKDGTRITKDANAAVAKYVDVFVREAIARSVAEREGGGFLEVSPRREVVCLMNQQLKGG
jgi:hypothetical protein